jgi:FkbM family methyltransferase
MKLFRSQEARNQLPDDRFIADVYRGILGRDPDEVGMRHYSAMLKSGTLDRVGLIASFVSSGEFAVRVAGAPAGRGNEPQGCLRSEAEEVFGKFQKYQGSGSPGFITNFLGVLTDVRFVGLDSLSGAVEGYPIPGNFHGDTLEWVGVLRSVLDARNSFTMLELGAGWAPWCTVGHLAAKQRGMPKIKVIAIEGDPGHVAFIRDTFAINGVGPDIGKAIHGVAGVMDGEALFPKANNPSQVYGGVAAFSEAQKMCGAYAEFTASHSALVEEIERVPCFSLATLLREYSELDLIHCDIQGEEANLFAHSIEVVSAKVKRVVVGTHSFHIDRAVACLFAKNDWDLEGIVACVMREDSNRPVIVHDGVQVWRNKYFRTGGE